MEFFIPVKDEEIKAHWGEKQRLLPAKCIHGAFLFIHVMPLNVKPWDVYVCIRACVCTYMHVCVHTCMVLMLVEQVLSLTELYLQPLKQ